MDIEEEKDDNYDDVANANKRRKIYLSAKTEEEKRKMSLYLSATHKTAIRIALRQNLLRMQGSQPSCWKKILRVEMKYVKNLKPSEIRRATGQLAEVLRYCYRCGRSGVRSYLDLLAYHYRLGCSQKNCFWNFKKLVFSFVANGPKMTLKMVLGCCPPRWPSNRAKYPPKLKFAITS